MVRTYLKIHKLTPSQQKEKMTENQLLKTHEAAALLDVSKHTLDVWRALGKGGPNYVKIGRNVRYKKSEIENFINRNSHITGESND